MNNASSDKAIPTVALLDARHQGVGGISALNIDLQKSILNSRFRFVRSGLLELGSLMRQEHAAGRPLICIFDESFSWRVLPRIFAARLLREKLSRDGWICRFIAREHHYTRSFVEQRVPSRARFELMLRTAYRAMDRVISVSQGQTNWLLDRKLCPPDKLETVIHAVNIQPLLDVPVSATRKLPTFGSMGRLSFQKGLEVLIDAWALLPATCKAQLLIAGFGPDEDALKLRARNLSGVTFIGKVTDRAKFFSEIDAMIMPSRYEPGAQVCIETRAAARLLVASDIDCFPEQPQECRLLFKRGDSHDLKNRILEMCEIITEGPYAAIAERARESAISVEQAYYPRLHSVLEGVLAKPKSARALF